MNRRQRTIQKYTQKCIEKNFEYISHCCRRRNPNKPKEDTFITCKCLECDYIKDFQSSQLNKGEVKCPNCLILKYQNKCLENGFKYQSHYHSNKQKIICKCLECGIDNDFGGSDLFNNSVKCKCKRKVFVKGFVYKLTINEYYYIGITDTTMRTRYSGHKKDCFNKTKNKYHSKIYRIIREQLCKITGKSVGKLTKEDFDKYVIQKQVAVVNTSRADLKSLESELINLSNCWCLNSIN